MTRFGLSDAHGEAEGLRYDAEFLSAAEERDLIAGVSALVALRHAITIRSMRRNP